MSGDKTTRSCVGSFGVQGKDQLQTTYPGRRSRSRTEANDRVRLARATTAAGERLDPITPFASEEQRLLVFLDKVVQDTLKLTAATPNKR
jgi:hypothetical protein